jgi:hypothetical protein
LAHLSWKRGVRRRRPTGHRRWGAAHRCKRARRQLDGHADAPALYDYGYRNGGYEFVNIDPNWDHYGEIPFGNPEPYERVSVDVALRRDEPGQVTYIGCRRASNEANG